MLNRQNLPQGFKNSCLVIDPARLRLRFYYRRWIITYQKYELIISPNIFVLKPQPNFPYLTIRTSDFKSMNIYYKTKQNKTKR